MKYYGLTILFFLATFFVPLISMTQNVFCEYDSIIIKVFEYDFVTRKYTYTIKHNAIDVNGGIHFYYKKDTRQASTVSEKRIRNYTIDEKALYDSINKQSCNDKIFLLVERIIEQRKTFDLCKDTSVFGHPNNIVDITIFHDGRCLDNIKIWKDYEYVLPIEYQSLMDILNRIKDDNEIESSDP